MHDMPFDLTAAADVDAVLRAVAMGELSALTALRTLQEAIGETRAWRGTWIDAPLHGDPCRDPLLILDDRTPVDDRGPQAACVVRLFGAERFSAGADAMAARMQRNLASLLALVPVLPPRARLLIVHPTLDGAMQPHLAALQGFARCVRREVPGLVVKTIAMPDAEAADDEIRREAGHLVSEDVRYAGGRRQVFSFEEAPLGGGGSPALRRNGVYLVTGGSGGLGRIICEHLITRHGVTAVPSGRSPSQMADYVQADITDRADVHALLAGIRRRYGRIDGIIHAAGVRQDSRIAGKTAAEAAAVLAPKVRGTMLLDEATRDDPLDCFVLFSAAAAAFGNAGQSDYAVANSFLDHFADWREARRIAGERQGRSLAIQWPLWAGGGMRVDQPTLELLKRTIGMMPMSRADGLAMFDAALGSGLTTLTVVCGVQDRIGEQLRGSPAMPSATAPAPAVSRAAETRLREEVTLLISQILKVPAEEVDDDEDLGAYGFDSITFTQLANSINRKYDLSVSPAMFYEFTTLAAVTAELAGTVAEPAVIMEEPPLLMPPPASAPPEPAPAIAPEPRRAEAAAATRAADIAIIGMSGALPGSPGLDAFWRHLAAGDDLISEVPAGRWDWRKQPEARWGGFIEGVDEFDCFFFGISPREAARMDPQQRLFLMHAWSCIEHAGYRASDLAGSRTGVFAGAASPDYHELLRQSGVEIDGFTSLGVSFSILVNRVSHTLGLRGPSHPVDTACSSSLVAVHQAVEAICRGECDAALAGGVNVLLSPTHTIAASRAGMLSADGRCKTFSERADGYVRGEGVGIVFLKPLARAIADRDTIHAVIKGSAENHGGHTGSLTTPNPVAQSEVLVQAWQRAGLDPSTAGYIEAHGTGTKLGDPVEINGLKSAFRILYQQFGLPAPAGPHCGLGSVKTNVGHLETGAGIAGLLKVVLALRHRWLPGTLHLDGGNPFIDLDGSPFYLCREGRAWPAPSDRHGKVSPRRAGVSSFGFGGSNAHVVLEEYPEAPPAEAATGRHLVVLSARNADRLREYADRLADWAESTTAMLADIALTLQAGREPMEERLALVADTREEMVQKLRSGRGVHRGSAAGLKRQSDALIGGAAGKAFAAALLREQDWDRLAQLWVTGADIDFGILPARGRRIALPTYPFARDRHWLPNRPSAAADGHALRRLTGDEFYLTDHVVLGRKTLPGVMYLELARAAMAAGGRAVRRMRNIVWSRPCAVDAGGCDIAVELSPSKDGLRFEISSGDGLHAQGLAPNTSGEPLLPVLDLAGIRRRCTATRTGAECYSAFDASGFTSGPAFHAIQELWHDDREALSRLVLPPHLPPAAAEEWRPSLLDGALETVIALLGETAGVPWLPFTLNEFCVSGPLPARCLAYVRRADGAGPGVFDIRIADESGRVVVEMLRFMFRPLAAAPHDTTACYVPVWEPQPAPPPRADVVPESVSGDIAALLRFAAQPGHAVFAAAEGDPALFAAAGFARSLRLEQPDARLCTLSIDDPSRLPGLLAAEAGSDETEVRYRGGERSVRRWQPIGSAATAPSLLKRGGRYLITGGAGGIGRLLAGHLIAEWDARVVLAGRAETAAALPPGAIYVQADVVNEASVNRLVARMRAECGGIDGVFHAAGVLRDGRAAQKTPADAAAVLAPKITGTRLVDAATRDDPLDFFLLFSSAAAALGNAGQADYAYANGFMAGLAKARSAEQAAGRRSGCTIAIDWPLWRDGGMQVDAEIRTYLRESLGIAPLPASAALQVIEWAMRARPPRVLVLHGEATKFTSLVPLAKPVERASPPVANAPVVDGLARFRQEFTEEVRATLELPAAQPLDLDDNLSGLGFDSLSFTALANRLNRRLGLDMTPAVFFEFPTLAAAVTTLFRRYRDRLDTRCPAEAPSTASDARVEIAGTTETASLPSGPGVIRPSALQEPDAGRLAPDSARRPNPEADGRPTPANGENAACPSPAVTQEQRPAPEDDPVAIVGMSGILPRSPDLAAFWEHLDRGDNLIAEVPASRWDWRRYHGDPAAGGNRTLARWGGFIDDIDRFDCLFFGISPREAELMDPQQRLLLETVWALIENAGHRPSELSGTRTGVFIGVSTTDYFEVLRDAEGGLNAHTATGVISSILPNRISFLLNLRGPSEAIDTACSSSLVAIHRAVEAIRSGACELAIAGGTNAILSPSLTVAGSKAGMLSRDGQCKTFDRDANGYVRGEGVGAVLLKPLSRARADGDHIYAVVRGTAVNHGGRAASLTAPNPAAQAEVIAAAQRSAGIDPTEVSYVEAHGTGTSLGDPIEIAGLTQAFADRFRECGREPPAAPYCAVGSTKTNIGHLEAAAGIAGVLKVLLAMQHGRLPRLANFRELNPYIRLEGTPFFLVTENRPWTGRRIAGVSSFGFGGVNAHVLLEHVDMPAAAPAEPLQPHLIVLSARDHERLRASAARLADALAPDADLAAIAYTLRAGREPMPARFATVVTNLGDLRARLLAFAAGETPPAEQDASATFDWTESPAGPGRRVPLPAYPFAGGRHWVSGRSAAGGLAALHPLLDSNQSTLDGVRFEKRFSGEEPYLRDHAVNGERILPGVVHLELARAAATLAHPGAPVRGLANVVWKQPIAVSGEPVTATIHLSGDAFELRTGGEPHAQGTILLGPAAAGDLDLAAIRDRCAEAWPADDCYARFSARGLAYGPSFRVLQSLHAGSDEALAEIAVPEPVPGYVLQPSALEGSLQGIVALIGGEPDANWLPWSLGSIEVLAPLPAHCVSHITRAGGGNGRVRSFNICITDVSGRILARLTDFALVTAAAPSASADLPPAARQTSSRAAAPAGQAAAERMLIRLVAEQTKVPAAGVRPHEPLERYGIDSILIVSLTRELEARFGELSKTLFFEHQTIADLAAYFAAHHADRLDAHQSETVPPPVRQIARPLPELRSPAAAAAGDIAVIGVSGRYPKAANLDAFWHNLRTGVDCISEIPPDRWDHRLYGSVAARWGGFLDDVDKFDPRFFNITPKEAELLDPQERLFLETVWHTLEDAGYTRASLAQHTVGVYAGVMWAEYPLFGPVEALRDNLIAPGGSFASIANRVSYLFNFHGPSLAIDTMCSSSLTALHLACEGLRHGETDLAIAGGVNLSLHPQKYILLGRGRFTASDGRCRSFGEGGDGYVPGEGVGAVLLKPLARAEADGDRIYAVIKSSAINHGGKTNGYTVPNPNAQAALIADALRKAGIDSATVGYVEAHGTGTSLGDPIEVNALAAAFGSDRREPCFIGSVKSNIGHLEGAAGIAALTKVLLQLRHGELVPSLHSHALNPNIDFQAARVTVVQEPRPWLPRGGAPRRAGISSFGAGGSNVHVILDEHAAPAGAADAGGPQVVVLSARTRERLDAAAAALAAAVRPGMRLADIAFTLQAGREAFPERLAFVAANPDELRQRLLTGDGVHTGTASAEPLVDGEEGLAFLRDLAAAGRLDKLAQLWAAGANADWAALGTARDGRRISLPGYPFARERYWIPAAGGPAPVPPRPGATRLSGDEPWLRDHRVDGAPVVPAAACLELARLACEQAGAAVAGLADMVWRSPIRTPQELEVHVDGSRVEFRAGGQVQADARVLRDETGGGAPLDLDAIRRRCQQRRDGAAGYEALRALGLDYGPSMRVLRGVVHNDREALAELQAADGLTGSDLRIALMDGALQTLSVFHRGSAAQLPFSLDRAAFIGPLPRQVYVCAEAAGEGRFDLTLADPAGRVLTRLEGLLLRPMHRGEDVVFLRRVWHETPSGNGSMPPAPAGPVVLLDGSDSIRGALEQRLGVPVHLVHPGESAHAALQAASRVVQIVPAEDADAESGIYPLLRATRALLARRDIAAAQILHLHPSAGTISPVSGYLKTLRQENPKFAGKTVGFEPSIGEPELIDIIAHEVSDGGSEPVSYVSGVRRAERLEEFVPVTDTTTLKSGGVYLISGGGGGLGRIFARYLTQTAGARVVLSGRSEQLPDDFTHDLGALYIPADLTDAGDAHRLIRDIRNRFGRLDGIIHSAGVLRDAFLLKQSDDDFAAVLAPKLSGARNLAAAAEGLDLDFFALFSSVAAVLGNVGQAAYAYANGWLDAFAAGFPGRALSVDWPLWQDGGMHAPDDVVAGARRSFGICPLSSDAGVRAFITLLDSKVRNAVVLAGDRRRILATLAAPPPAPPPDAARPVTPPAATPGLRAQTERYLAGVLAVEAKLSPDEIDAATRLEDYGIDSVMVMAATRELETVFGRLPKTLFFEYASIAELAGYFLKEHAARLAARFAAAVPLSAQETFGATAGDGISRPAMAAASPPSAAGAAVSAEQAGADPAAAIAGGERLPAAPARAIAAAPAAAPVVRPDRIAIIGLSGRYPMAEDLRAFWRNLAEGRDCITEVPPGRWDHRAHPGVGRWGGFLDGIDRFDPLFFHISPREAKLIDPQERLFLETAWHTLEDAGYTRRALAGARAGVYVGVMWSEYQLLGLGAARAPSATHASIANRVSFFLNLRGASLAVDTMCSSSLTALHLACEALRLGEIDYALAGGVNLSLHPEKYRLLTQGHFLSSDGRCRSFGADGDGYVPGEGVGAVLLKPLERAIADGDHIAAVITATALNHGGRTNGYTVPNPRAQAGVIADALRLAGVDPGLISYVEAHGTGTPLGDPIELAGLVEAFGPMQGSCAIGSVKSNIGHLEAAAGIAGLTKVLLQMRHGMLVPSLHAETLNSHLEFDGTPFAVQRTLAPWQAPRRAGLSSFGAGGSNAHVLLEDYPQPASLDRPGPHIVLLSARNPSRLQAYAERLAAFIEAEHPPLADVAYTLQIGREAMECRAAFVVDTADELCRQLRAFAGGAPLREGLAGPAAEWLAGQEVDWEALHTEGRPRRMSLPGYPFADERYWLATPPAPRGHRLIDGLSPALCLRENAAVLTRRLTPDEPIVRDHLVRGVPVMPGAGYLEMALAAAAEVEPGRRFSLADVVWLRPLAVTGEALDVRVVLRSRGDALSYEVRTDAGLHGRGLLRPAESGPQPSAGAPGVSPGDAGSSGALGPIDAIRARCPVRLDGETLYQSFAASGLQYGPFFRCIRRIWCGSAEALAEIALPPGVPADGYTLHPALLDAALQAIAGLQTGPQGGTTLSFAAELVELLLPMPLDARVHVRRTKPDSFDIVVLDPAGNACVRLRNVTVRAMADPSESLLFIPAWQPIELPSGTPAGLDGCTVAIAGEPVSHRFGSRAVFINGPEALLAAAASWPDQAPVLLLTIGALAARGADRPDPEAAAAAAFAAALAKDRPELRLRILDVSTAAALGQETTRALAERWMAGGATGPAAIRDGRIHRRTATRLDLPAAATPFRDRGVYVIIGGAGGLGFELSKHLARSCHARLAWIGRRQRDAAIDAQCDEIALLGGTVFYTAADVADGAALAGALAAVRTGVGPINGVFHSAMDVRPQLVKAMDAAGLRAALRAKTLGSANLLERLEYDAPDFLVFFSSVQSFVCARGMAAYAAGCAYQDALALRAAPRFPVQTINWGYWGTVGEASESAKRLAESLGFASIEPAEGLAALDRILAAPERPQVICFKGDAGLLTAPAPAFADTASNIRPEALPFDPEVLKRLGAAATELRSFGQRTLLRMFQDMGIFTRAGANHRPGDLRIAPAQRRQFDALLDILILAGYIRRSGDTVTCLTLPDLPAPALEDIAARHPDIAAHARFVSACLRSGAAMLRGEAAGTDVLFPHGDRSLVEGIYAGNPSVDYFNRQTADIVRDLAGRRPGTVRILEIGAGTGSATRGVLAALAPDAARIRYCYTDKSPAFVQLGRRMFGQPVAETTFVRLDIEQDPPAQGVAGPFDIIIAVNVLHATRDIGETLRHVKTLLAPAGMLVLSETTSVQESMTLTFGFLDGWWRFQDGHRRLPGSPLLDAAGWHDAFAEAGLHPAGCVTHPSISGYEPPQCVLLASAPAVTGNPGPASVVTGNPGPAPVVTGDHGHAPVVAGDPGPAQVVTGDRGRAPAVAGTPGLVAPDEAIRASLAQVLEIDPQGFDRDTPYVEFGVDSILAVEIVDRINERLGIGLRATDLFNYPTIATLAAHIATSFAPAGAQAAELSGDGRMLDLLRRLAAGEIDQETAQRQVAELVEPA
nr:SDR family NAD(P)-dependent oxidoreductase [uncultured Rhodopila sp.]